MIPLLYTVSYKLDNLNGLWFCEEHKLLISINKDKSNNKFEISYICETIGINNSETTEFHRINDVTGLNCQLGKFTVFFDGKEILHLLAYFPSEKSYLFERL